MRRGFLMLIGVGLLGAALGCKTHGICDCDTHPIYDGPAPSNGCCCGGGAPAAGPAPCCGGAAISAPGAVSNSPVTNYVGTTNTALRPQAVTSVQR